MRKAKKRENDFPSWYRRGGRVLAAGVVTHTETLINIACEQPPRLLPVGRSHPSCARRGNQFLRIELGNSPVSPGLASRVSTAPEGRKTPAPNLTPLRGCTLAYRITPGLRPGLH